MKDKRLNSTISTLALLAMIFCFDFPARALPGAADEGYATTGYYRDDVPASQSGAANNEQDFFNAGAVTPDGGLIVVGSMFRTFPSGHDAVELYVQKLTPTGGLDTSFGSGGTFRLNFGLSSYCVARTVKIQADGKIVLGGGCYITASAGSPPTITSDSGFGMFAARLNANGTLDNTFGGNTFTVQHSPTFPNSFFTYTMPAGTTFVHYPGQIETGYGGRGASRAGAYDMAIHADGRIVLAGNTVTRDFNQNGTVDGFNHVAAIATLTPSGGLSSAQLLPGDQSFERARRSSGRGFNTIEVKSDGTVVAAGMNDLYDASNNNFLGYRLWIYDSGTGANYYSDPSLGPGVTSIAHSIVFLRSNKILVSGKIPPPNSGTSSTSVIMRFNSDLTLDTTFGVGGRRFYCFANFNGCTDIVPISTGISVQSVLPDGKILAVGDSVAHLQNPYPNPSFGGFNDGDKIYRFNPDGTPDRSFGDATNQNPNTLTNYGSQFPWRVAASGVIVQSIVELGFVTYQTDGKILTGGRYNPATIAPRLQAGVSRRENTFRQGGIYSDFDNDGRADVSVFRNGSWYYLNSFGNVVSGVQFGAATDKPAPADFDGDGKTDVAVFRPSNGTWYIYQSSNNQVRGVGFGAAEDLPRPGDFNGDGQADVAVWRPSNGTWYISYSNPVQPGNITFAAIQFGQAGDIPLLADFDADGKSDIAVYRGGFWYYLRSSDGGFRSVQFGASGDAPVVGDYDADSRSDVAVFRPSNGTWYRTNSSNNGFVFTQFGQNGDKAVPGDYDKDGKNDLAVFRNGIWYVQRSSDNSLLGTAFGNSTDTPIPAVYLP